MKFLVPAWLVAGSLLTSCGDDHKQQDSKEVSEERNEAKMATRAQEKDAEFLVEAATLNLEEVKLGQIAATNAKMPEVKELAAKMVTEHQKSYDQLTALAAKKQVTIPTSMPDKVKEDTDKMSGKMGKEFDKDYCDKMVEAHKDAITKFEKASTDAADTDIRTWAGEMLPVLRKHLDEAMACREKCDKVYK